MGSTVTKILRFLWEMCEDYSAETCARQFPLKLMVRGKGEGRPPFWGTMSPGDFNFGRCFWRNNMYICAFKGSQFNLSLFRRHYPIIHHIWLSIYCDFIQIWWNMLKLNKNPADDFDIKPRVPRRHKILLRSELEFRWSHLKLTIFNPTCTLLIPLESSINI